MPVQYQSYGGYSTAPAPASASQLASWQQQQAAAQVGVQNATAQRTAGQSSNRVWAALQRAQAGGQAAAGYGSALGAAGEAGVGRNAGVQGTTANAVNTALATAQAQIQQQTADKNSALQQVLDQARRQQRLVQQNVAQQQALVGSDPSALIAAASTIRSVQ